MKRMFKYVVPVLDWDTEVRVGANAQIRHVGCQREGEVTFWAEVPSPAQECETRVFRVIGTGHEVPLGFTYVGTTFDGPFFVWHLYEGTP